MTWLRGLLNPENNAQDISPAQLDFSTKDLEIINGVRPFTMTSPERIKALIDAVEYILRSEIDGSIVECGVWKGGSIMAAIHTLIKHGQERQIYLYDTFEGMSEPTEFDKDVNGAFAKTRMQEESKVKSWVWAYSTLEEVIRNVKTLPYDYQKINFIKGKVEDTLPDNQPDQIAILRLDTDWYESTKAELHYLYPKVVKGGVVIIDDYGHWEGARKAVDEFIRSNKLKIFLHRIDYTGRLFVKG